MNLRTTVVIASVLLSACRISVPEGVLPCRSSEDCPVAWSCDRGRCSQTLRESPVQAEVAPQLRDAAVSSEHSNFVPDAAVVTEQTPPPMFDEEDAGPPSCDAMGCGCREGETKPCYSGTAGSIGHGRCGAGIATCQHGSFGACADERLPAGESCANVGVDDDCDGRVDEDESLGQACVAAEQLGECARGTLQCQDTSAPICAAGSPVAESCNGLDDDCDGLIDEAFVLTSDAQHCGSCGAACAAEQVCCGGQCQAAWPESYGSACGGACDTPGTIQCDGSCDRADPPRLDEACGQCGGRIQCDGNCSNPEPPDYGVRCNDGISTIGCSGSCECERQCPSGQIIPCSSLCPILCIGNICIEL